MAMFVSDLMLLRTLAFNSTDVTADDVDSAGISVDTSAGADVASGLCTAN